MTEAGKAAEKAAEESAETIIELVETIDWRYVVLAFMAGGLVVAAFLWATMGVTLPEPTADDQPSE